MKFRLQLVRHGKTYASVHSLYCGSTDIALCDKGVREVEENVETNIYDSAEIYFTSGMKRTTETLSLICKDCTPVIIDDLKEMNFGDFEMKKHEELMDDKRYVNWIEQLDRGEDGKCPGGESHDEFNERIKNGFEQLCHYIYKNGISSAMLVAHGGTIGYIMLDYAQGFGSFYEAMPPQGRGYDVMVSFNDNKISIDEYKRI